MSDHLNGKDYDAYFHQLEERLPANRTEQNRQSAVREDSKHKRKKSVRYRVIRLRPAAVFAVLLAVILLLAGTIGIVRAVKKNGGAQPAEKTVSGSKTPGNSAEDETSIAYLETAKTADIPADNDAGSAIIINTKTHEIVAQRSPRERFYPASTTKIMSLLVAAEQITDFDDTFTMTLEITDRVYLAEATVAGFSSGETVSMSDLLYGLILPSGGDAALGLAVKISGSEEAFVGLMNKKAESLGLTGTHFENCTGLFDKNHYTTAYDMAVILERALQNSLCKKILSTFQYTTAKTPQHPEGILLTSTLFENMYGTEPETATVLGGKTGYVNESGYCIASFGTNNTTGAEYIVVTLKNSARWPAFLGQIALYKEFVK